MPKNTICRRPIELLLPICEKQDRCCSQIGPIRSAGRSAGKSTGKYAGRSAVKKKESKIKSYRINV